MFAITSSLDALRLMAMRFIYLSQPGDVITADLRDRGAFIQPGSEAFLSQRTQDSPRHRLDQLPCPSADKAAPPIVCGTPVTNAYVFHVKPTKQILPFYSTWDLKWGQIFENIVPAFNLVRITTMVSFFGVALYAVIQTILSVGATVSAVKTNVTYAAQGAYFLGIWAIALKCLPLAGSLFEFIIPTPPPVAAEPLMILGQLGYLDAGQWSAVGCTALSFLGWLLGKMS